MSLQSVFSAVPSLTHQTTSEKEHSSTPSSGESDERKGNEVVEERRHPKLNSKRKSAVSFAETSGSDYPDGREESSDVEKNSSIASQRNSRESSADVLFPYQFVLQSLFIDTLVVSTVFVPGGLV